VIRPSNAPPHAWKNFFTRLPTRSAPASPPLPALPLDLRGETSPRGESAAAEDAEEAEAANAALAANTSSAWRSSNQSCSKVRRTKSLIESSSFGDDARCTRRWQMWLRREKLGCFSKASRRIFTTDLRTDTPVSLRRSTIAS